MENFTAYNPTTLHFGKGVVETLSATLKNFGTNVLLVYGQGSVKRSGLYGKVIEQLKAAGCHVTEYGGIKPNPRIEDVDTAAEAGRRHNADVILAVGGGSVIDSAKIISIAIPVANHAWDFYENKIKPKTAVPVIAILTLAATGTEMNPFAVQQNSVTGKKLGFGNPLCYPSHSFLDPEVTFTVPANYTAYGIADLMAHCLENYFSKGDCTLSDRIIFAIMQDAMEWGPKLMNNLNGYKERAAIMYDATLALNGLTSNGKGYGDWGVHALGHVLSLLHDTAHGASLSIMFPAWMKVIMSLPAGRQRLEKLGMNLFGTSDPKETIHRLEAFFRQIGCPLKLHEVNITEHHHAEIVDTWQRNGAEGNNFKLGLEEYARLIEYAK